MIHYKFDNPLMDCDELKSGRIVKYKEVHSIACNESEARVKAKLSDDYKLVGEFELNKDWK